MRSKGGGTGGASEPLLYAFLNIKNVNFINIEVSIINLYENNYNHWKVLDFLKNNNFEPIFFDLGIRDKKGKLIECDILFEKQN